VAPTAGARLTAPLAAKPRTRKGHQPARVVKASSASWEVKFNELSEDLDALLYSISHDLRAPLRAIDGFTDALVEEYGDVLDETGREYLTVLQGANRHMRALLEGVLLLSRLGRRSMHLKDIDLSLMAASVGAELAAADPRRQVVFCAGAGIHGQGDPDLVREVMRILADNAWKFTRIRKDARIDFGAEGNVFFIRDNGIGFDSHRVENAELLLAPFQVLHPAEDGSGVGVGLAAAHRIVRRHGGRIWAEAEVDKGATFYFTLAGDAG
jgi:signal transduction histidine kinase